METARLGFLAAVALFSMAAASSSADQSQRVLLLNSFGSRFSPYSSFVGQFRADLISRSPRPLDVYEASLETARFSDTPKDDPFVNYLRALSVERPPDLVVTIGGAAARFAQTHRDRLFPSTPLLVTAVEERRLQANALTANDAALPLRLDLRAVIENIRQVLPETTNVFVVIGSSPLEKFWRQELAAAFEQFEGRLAFEWSDEMPFDETLRRAATLPPGAVVLYAMLLVDVEGVPFEEDRALAGLHAATNRPVFGLFDTEVGEGIVGGPLLPIDDLAGDAADTALRILDGKSPGGIVAPPRGPSPPVFDKRELDRWGISEFRLPHRQYRAVSGTDDLAEIPLAHHRGDPALPRRDRVHSRVTRASPTPSSSGGGGAGTQRAVDQRSRG